MWYKEKKWQRTMVREAKIQEVQKAERERERGVVGIVPKGPME